MSNRVRCLYDESFVAFLAEGNNSIFGKLCSNYHGDAQTTTREAWVEEIEILKNVISGLECKDGRIIFEYDIPRLGKRIDVVLLWKGIVFCLEFKTGQKDFPSQTDIDQVFDYALDLNNFHLLSQDRVIAPILIPTMHRQCSTLIQKSSYSDNVINPLVTGKTNLLGLLKKVVEAYPNEEPIDTRWTLSPYSPTPTIIEAARALYENHSVEDITRHEADKVSTDRTIAYIMRVIEESKAKGKKTICFVTGVPGAGKTLVGLDVAIKQSYQGQDHPVEGEGAVYLSGNGPLVAVLTEALARDNVKKLGEKKIKKKITDARREVRKSIQMIHLFRDNMLQKIVNPVQNGVLEIDPNKAMRMSQAGYGEVEHIAIFDEAQRSWTQKRLVAYLKRGGTYGNKLKVPNFPWSEAAFLIWSLDQREDWATIICLVGGGQEINTGEAGISEWIYALNELFPHWEVHISNKLTDPEYAEGRVNQLLGMNKHVVHSDDLHLSVSLRSFRAEKLSAFVHAILDCDVKTSAALYSEIKDKYPLVLTRDMSVARKWLREKVRGSERTGVLVSKESARYKPLAVHILPNDDENTIHWFLEDKTDVRSSNYLEDAMTEIQVQGLELDYTCLLWDADVRFENGQWAFYRFSNNKWVKQSESTESQAELMKYMLNAYRVLLTRARCGMVICVPKGNPNMTYGGFPEDATRLPEFYDSTFDFLKSIGIDEL